MKNFILVQAPVTVEASHLLLHLDPAIPDDQREFGPFTHYSRWLAQRGYAFNTDLLYSEHVGRFIDYVYEVSISQFDSDVELSISSIIYSYQSFLLFGKSSSNPIAARMAEQLGKEKTTSQSSLAQTIESSIRWFLQVCETRNSISPDTLFSRFYINRPEYRQNHEISAIKANSWLAGTIRDALVAALPKRKGETLFPRAKRRDRKNDKQAYKTVAFPIETSVSLVRQEKPKRSKVFHRDMAIYALLAASGGRTSEVLQLRLIDIDADNLAVYLRDPFSRKNPGITEEEHRLLAWKGRDTEITFLIEPFGKIFFEHLEQYLALEYNSSCGHDFLFQDIDGRPYFTSDRSSRDKTFKSYASRAGLADCKGISLHSLRHMYGTYTLNYMPVPGQETPGLPLTYVKILMGHSNITSTMKYAKHDTDLIEAYFHHANQYITLRGEQSMSTIRQEFHIRQLEILQQEVQRIEGTTA
ncbi:Tyrosine recombinase XerC [Pseudomonas extremaustralis]|uniref:Tyrosine recombinase XerC n=1 Tax=Pseudomonas extremaustralis TaxID=359110 RepID=A0A5M9IN67_9PSED|nr:site-specific integrase [Pseudomonas extremaustralis]KAA8558007.1 Tyrosine recombinase XerC [Pseudomonas extremaustralis]